MIVTAESVAAGAGAARSTASEHLNLLVAAGLLAEERMAHPRAAQLLEDLGAVAGEPLRPTSLCTELPAREWVVRASRHRAVRLTPAGTGGLRELLGSSPAGEVT